MNHRIMYDAAMAHARKLLDSPRPPWWRCNARRREEAIEMAIEAVRITSRQLREEQARKLEEGS